MLCGNNDANLAHMAPGVSEEVKHDLLCLQLRQVAVSLDLPSTVIATVLRFFRATLTLPEARMHDVYHLASASVFLAARCCELPRRLTQIIPLCEYIRHTNLAKPPPYLSIEQYFEIRTAVLLCEAVVLTAVGFAVSPVPTTALLCELLAASDASEILALLALSIHEDVSGSQAALGYPPDIFVAGILLLAARLGSLVTTPDAPASSLAQFKSAAGRKILCFLKTSDEGSSCEVPSSLANKSEENTILRLIEQLYVWEHTGSQQPHASNTSSTGDNTSVGPVLPSTSTFHSEHSGTQPLEKTDNCCKQAFFTAIADCMSSITRFYVSLCGLAFSKTASECVLHSCPQELQR